MISHSHESSREQCNPFRVRVQTHCDVLMFQLVYMTEYVPCLPKAIINMRNKFRSRYTNATQYVYDANKNWKSFPNCVRATFQARTNRTTIGSISPKQGATCNMLRISLMVIFAITIWLTCILILNRQKVFKGNVNVIFCWNFYQ